VGFDQVIDRTETGGAVKAPSVSRLDQVALALKIMSRAGIEARDRGPRDRRRELAPLLR